MNLPQPWLSVITVVKDDRTGFEATRTSLLAQQVAGVEHVVVDGSTDRFEIPTVLDATAGSGPPTAYSWVPPSGVYTAMNAGIQAASGEYVYFANAGDRFYDESVLAYVRQITEAQSPAWMYGEIAIRDTHGHTVVTPRWDYAKEKAACFSRGRFPAHQATFVRRTSLLEVGGFDTRYRIVADYAAFLRLSERWTPVYLDLIVATFSEGGLSTQSWRESLREFHRARIGVLRPTGARAVRERFETLRQKAAMGLYRGIVRRPRP